MKNWLSIHAPAWKAALMDAAPGALILGGLLLLTRLT